MANQPKNHPDPAAIAIVGAGFSGIAVALRLLDPRVALPRRVILIESAARVGRGRAYDTDLPVHLLNVPAGRMSGIPGQPGHFLNWLRARLPEATGGSFVARHWYGAYLEETLAAAAGRSGPEVTLELRRGRVIDLEPAGTGVTVRFVAGPILRADRVVVATGHLPPAAPPHLSPAAAAHERFIADPWTPGWVHRVRPDDSVVCVGTGLTMVDAVLGLRDVGHSGSLSAISRRGFLPQAHRGLRHDPGRQPPPNALTLADPTVLGYWRAIRSAVAESVRAGGDWRDVIAALRPVTADLWRRLPVRERARFLRHAQSIWDSHRHRAAPEAARQIAALQKSGTLRVAAGRITAVGVAGEGLLVRWRARGGSVVETGAGAVINCTGPGTDLARAGDPLWSSLRTRGLIRQDPLRLGIATGEHGELVGRNGATSRAMFYVGPLLRAGWWEATAVPELAEHAVRTAEAVLDSIDD